MKLHEYQAKEIFARYGILIPNSKVAYTPDEARDITNTMGGRAAVKAQVHAGGRGKAGGVKIAQTSEEAYEFAKSILGKYLVTPQTDDQGVPVNSLLIEELAEIESEIYIAITIDRDSRSAVMITSPSGGTDIEEVAHSTPEMIFSDPIEPVLGLMPFQTRRMTRQLGLEGQAARDTAKLMMSLYQIYIDNDCSLIEINPLIITKDQQVVALDAKLDIEDDALFRHADLQELRDRSQEDQLEAAASDQDIAYVNLDGDTGCLVNGAGLAMATLDVANAAGAAPANFLDVGGGATDEKVAEAVSIILSDPKVKRVLVNVFGGILRCDVAARGTVLAYKRNNCTLPLIVRMLGTNLEEGKEILRDSGLNVIFADTLTEAAKAISESR